MKLLFDGIRIVLSKNTSLNGFFERGMGAAISNGLFNEFQIIYLYLALKEITSILI